VVCSEAIAAADRAYVLARLRSGARELIELDQRALRAFAGNILELVVDPATIQGVSAGAGPQRAPHRVLAMSASARAALTADPAGWERLLCCIDAVIAVPVPTIEAIGGGSVRCMLAEIPAVGP